MAAENLTLVEATERRRLLDVALYDVAIDLTAALSEPRRYRSTSTVTFSCIEPGATAHIDITADAVFGGKFRQIDANEVMGKVVFAAMPEPVVLARIAYSELDHALIPEWVSSLEAAIKSLQAIKSSLKKELTRDQL